MRFLLEPLGRLAYLAWGVSLFVVKVMLDWAVARHFDKHYSVLFYVSPMNAPLFRPGDDLGYWLSLSGVMMPFVVVGVALTLRRLRDAGLSPWFALLFFVPFANLLFFLIATLAPPQPRTPPPVVPPPYRPVPEVAPEQRSPTANTWLAGGLGAVIALGSVAVGVGLFAQYGAALLVGSPFTSGFAAGLFYARLAPGRSLSEGVRAGLISCVILFGALIVFAIEGIACLIMAAPLLVFPCLAGALLGQLFGNALGPRKSTEAVIGSVLVLGALFAAERLAPLPETTPPVVRTEIEIDAPPERVWSQATSVPEMGEPRELAFRVGIAFPTSAVLEGEGVGARRRCEFNTGTALETIDRWEPPRAFGFRIDQQPDVMRETTLWNGPRQPHLQGMVHNVRGEFHLEPLPNGRTRLIGISEYRIAGAPEPYWRLFSTWAIGAVHRRVLAHVKMRAEAPPERPVAVR